LALGLPAAHRARRRCAKQARGAAIASLCAESHELPPAPLLRALWRREQAGSTALGHGVAIPHARIEGIDHPLTLFVRTRAPIPFRAPDGEPVADLYAIFVPMRSDYDAHLELLARIVAMLSDPELRARVATASTSAVAHSIFAQWVVHHMRDPLVPKTGRSLAALQTAFPPHAIPRSVVTLSP
jgi:PTS system nitrogen regulatory IIA component